MVTLHGGQDSHGLNQFLFGEVGFEELSSMPVAMVGRFANIFQVYAAVRDFDISYDFFLLEL
jgi:hypothetical protein